MIQRRLLKKSVVNERKKARRACVLCVWRERERE